MKKLAITLFVALMIGTSFYVGRATAEPKEIIKEVVVKDNENLINPSDITDWNTNGEEISLITKDGYEYYAYKSKNVYDNLRYYNIKEVDSWKVLDGNILEIKFSDGNVYEWSK